MLCLILSYPKIGAYNRYLYSPNFTEKETEVQGGMYLAQGHTAESRLEFRPG
jgi:hypothetical protein